MKQKASLHEGRQWKVMHILLFCTCMQVKVDNENTEHIKLYRTLCSISSMVVVVVRRLWSILLTDYGRDAMN